MAADSYKNRWCPQGLGGVVHDPPTGNDQGSTDPPDFWQLESFHDNFGTDSGRIAHGNRQKRFGRLRGGHEWITCVLPIWQEKFCARMGFLN